MEEAKARICRAKGLMYIDVKINGKPIRAMVDTGATHIYLACIEVERLGLVLEKGSGKVKAINSTAQPIAGVVKSVLIKAGPFEGRTNLSAVQMDDFKLILGLEFLWDTKTAVLPYSDSLMMMGNKPCVIPTQVGRMEEIEEANGPIPKPVKRLIQEFEDIMPDELPKKLPPRKTIDHEIELIPGAKPPAREKANGSLRMCCDYRALNKITVKNSYPIPLVADCFDRLGQAKYYTKIDLRSRYWQVQIKEGDEAKTTVVTRYGAFEFKVMPFGLTNAPTTFYTMMNQVLHGFLDDFVVVYVDGIVIYSETLEEHVQHKGYSEIALSLIELTKKDKDWDWSSQYQTAFDRVLMQEGHPVAYESRKLNQTERRYSAHEKELLTVVHCLRGWRHYLLGSSFIVKIDNTVVSYFIRRADLAAICSIAVLSGSTVSTNTRDQIRALMEKDPATQYLVDLINEDKGRPPICPKGGDLRKSLITECHDTIWVGHPGEECTCALLQRAYYWPQMRDDIATYVKTCLICQQDKADHQKRAGLLEPLSVLTRPFESVSMDYIIGLPKVEDFGTIIIVVDHLSKYATFIAAPKYVSVEETAQLFFKHIVKYWGLPKDIICFNVQKSSSTNKSHFEIVTGQQPLLPHTVDIERSTKSPQAKNFSQEWKRKIEIARSYLEKAQERYKKAADLKRHFIEFNFYSFHLFPVSFKRQNLSGIIMVYPPN
ncbi:uncharacterized protein LOC111404384 [Olea europaea var. sylvestris]|uniref:uncharacterized protein LOC111404384 n=1 Tax=Olea europaea var. sylvestris TaxID=158386 RepID=UPI000C1CE382|nr:uncharacterized protein LOC111404384 [Olea europaea var. sylvestris]